jgi:hypothetical protein
VDSKRKNELLKELAPEVRGTKIEAAFLSTYEDGYTPMWERAAKPLEQVAQERAELLARERRIRRKLEMGASSSVAYDIAK